MTWREWLAGPADPVIVSVLLWAFAAIAVAYLRYDATIWADLARVARRQLRIRDFVANGYWCDICSTYWWTTPVLAVEGPIVWLAANGLYLVAARNWPTLKPLIEPEPEPEPPAPIDPETGLRLGLEPMVTIRHAHEPLTPDTGEGGD